MAWSRVFRIGGVSGQWLREPRSPLRLALMSALGLPSNTPLRLHPVEVAPVVADHEVEAYVVNIYMRSSECVRVRRLASRFVADTQLDGGVVLLVIYRGGQVGEGLVLCMERQGRTRRDASDRRVWSRLVREAHGGGLATECEDDCERDRGSDPLPGD
jgi:hypothetical protein